MKIEKSEQMFNGRILKVYKDTVTLDNGRTVTREVIRHQGASAVLPLTEEGDVLLVRQFRYALGREILEVPAGLKEPGESPEECARRETEEETGFRPGSLTHLFDYYSSPGYCTECVSIYLAKDLTETSQHLDPDEDVTVIRMPLEEAVEKVRSGEIVDGKTIAALMAAMCSRV